MARMATREGSRAAAYASRQSRYVPEQVSGLDELVVLWRGDQHTKKGPGITLLGGYAFAHEDAMLLS
jgi:hypothetical protein